MRIKETLLRTAGVTVAAVALALSTVSAQAATSTTSHAATVAATHTASVSTEQIRPELTFGGSSILSYWIDFNQTDQTALIAGDTALLVAFICLVAPEACALTGIIAPVAEVYLQKYGRCPHKETMRAYYSFANLTGVRCLK